MNYLTDTNILSELCRPSPHPGVVQWAGEIKAVCLSVVTVEELEFGLAWKPNPKISGWLKAYIEQSCDVLPVTDAIARLAGSLRGRLRAAGQCRSQADMLIAATAAVHGLTLVTRNTRDFLGCGVAVLDPFLIS